MAELIKKISEIKFTTQQLNSLGLSPDWNKNISPKFVEKVVKITKRVEPAIKELAKY